MQAMLLAAGLGTRLHPYTRLRPKPLFPVLGRPLLHILLDMLAEAGCAPLVVNCHHLGDQVRAAVADRPVILQEEATILGTGGSLRQALPHCRQAPLLVMNGDICHSIDLVALYQAHCRAGGGVTLALHDRDRYNTVAVRGDRVTGFAPRPRAGHLAFTGVHVVDPDIIGLIPPGRFFHIIDLYRQLAPQDRIGFVRVDGCFWRDMGTKADYLALHRDLLHRRHFPWQPPMPPSGRWLHPQARVAKEAVLSGWVAVGAGAQVLPGAFIQDCVIWDQATVPRGCHRRTILT